MTAFTRPKRIWRYWIWRWSRFITYCFDFDFGFGFEPGYRFFIFHISHFTSRLHFPTLERKLKLLQIGSNPLNIQDLSNWLPAAWLTFDSKNLIIYFGSFSCCSLQWFSCLFPVIVSCTGFEAFKTMELESLFRKLTNITASLNYSAPS